MKFRAHRGTWIALCGLTLLLAACGPVVPIYNRTNMNVKVMILPPGGQGSEIIGVDANGEAGFELSLTASGTFQAVAIKSEEWISALYARREALAGKLVDPAQMKRDDIASVFDEFKQLSLQLDALKKANSGGSCTGTIDTKNDTTSKVEIYADESYNLYVTCADAAK